MILRSVIIRNLRYTSIIKQNYFNQSNSLIYFHNLNKNLRSSLWIPNISHKMYNTLVKCNPHTEITSKFDTDKRYFSKKKSSRKDKKSEEEESDEEEDSIDDNENLDMDGYNNLISRNVPSLRVDAILKAGLNVSKKKVEKDFYSAKIRLNGEKVTKKATTVSVGDELDLIRGFSQDSSKLLVVDRVILANMGGLTGTAMYPVKLEVLKELIIENYEDPWSPSSVLEVMED